MGSLSLFQRIFPTQGLNPGDSCIAGGFFTSWATREAKNTGAGSLSLLQRILMTQESNRGLLLCRQIFYQLNYRLIPHWERNVKAAYCHPAYLAYLVFFLFSSISFSFSSFISKYVGKFWCWCALNVCSILEKDEGNNNNRSTSAQEVVSPV